jgi:hypothetical protein
MKSFVLHLSGAVSLFSLTVYGAFVLPHEVETAAKDGSHISDIKMGVYQLATTYGMLVLALVVCAIIIGALWKKLYNALLVWVGVIAILCFSWWIAGIISSVVFIMGWAGAIIFIVVMSRIGKRNAAHPGDAPDALSGTGDF